MSSTLLELQEFIKQDLPVPRKRETTIFDIAGFPHYENVMSSCYAYFLNQEAGHQLSGVFIDTLLQLIEEETGKELAFDTWEANTEVSTNSGKRIDILIAPPEGQAGPQIIIENKIYHWLHNDLLDYWNHCACSDSEKVGVILSLKPENIPDAAEGKFVNILHAEWTEAIRSVLDKLDLDQKYQVYVQDFLTALDNLKTDIIMDDRIRFFFDNCAKINQLIETQNEAHRFIIQQLRATADKLRFVFSGAAYDYRYVEIPELVGSGVFYTIIFNNLLNEQRTIRVVIEVQAKVRHRVPEFDEATSNLVEQLGLLSKPHEHKGAWLHYVGKDYTFTVNEMDNFCESLANYIRTDFQPVMNMISKILKQQ